MTTGVVADLERDPVHPSRDLHAPTASVVTGAPLKSSPVISATCEPIRTAVAPLSSRHACGASSSPSTTTSSTGRGRTRYRSQARMIAFVKPSP